MHCKLFKVKKSWRVVKTITQFTIQQKEHCLTPTMSPYTHHIKEINQMSEWEHVNEGICFFLWISYYFTSCRLPTDTQWPINLAAQCRGAWNRLCKPAPHRSAALSSSAVSGPCGLLSNITCSWHTGSSPSQPLPKADTSSRIKDMQIGFVQRAK